MPNENKSDDPPADAQAQPIPKTPITPFAPQQDEVGHKTDNAPRNKKDKAIELEQEIRSGERWLIGITGASVIMSVVIALIYYGQLCQMRKATEKAGISAEAAKSAADTASRALKFSDESFGKTLAQMKAQTTAQEAAFGLDERAWVEIEKIDKESATPTPPSVPGPPAIIFTYLIRLKNFEKTSARNVLVRANTVGGNADMGENQAVVTEMLQKAPTLVRTPKVIAPNESSAVPFGAIGGSPILFNGSVVSSYVAYYMGRIDYDDVF
jgi:hypothetical protein